jgi:hypothetical protein
MVTLLVASGAAKAASDATSQRADQPSMFESRYGPLGLFDSRSVYGKGEFPEPFLVDDSDLEINEARLDWFHQEGRGQQTDTFHPEFEKGFGLVTLEVEGQYEYDTFRQYDSTSRRSIRSHQMGFDNIDVGLRAPFFQFVSDDEFFDTTFGTGIEVGVPTNSPVSKNTELVPKLFNDTRIGDHFTMQSIVGYSWLLGSKPDGGSQTFEYGLVFGWTFQHRELPIPDVQQFIPMFELLGTTLANTPDAGLNGLIGNAAFRVNLKAIDRVQPRLGIGYVFPLDQGGRTELRWGIVTSLVFEF